MAIELLDPRQHGHLRLRATTPEVPHFVQILAPEFPAAAACCRILFTKDTTTGGFFAGAMFGFKPGENLLASLEDRGGFNPLMVQREGFFISEQNIAIDPGHARFSETEGEPLFDGAQQPADGLRAVQRTLGSIHQGLEQTRAFIAALLELMLIESIDISLGFADGERLSLQGLYTVSLDRLRDVDDPTALRLFRAGHLQLAYVMAASLRHLGRPARLRNRRA